MKPVDVAERALANTSSLGTEPRPGALDMSFDPGSGVDKPIHTLALQPDGKIVISGEFTRVNGLPRNYLARLNADGSVDSIFDPRPGIVDTGSYSRAINALIMQPDGKLLVGGAIKNYNGLSVTNVVRINADGSLDETFGPDLNIGIVLAMALLEDGSVLVGKYRSSVDPPDSGLVHLDRNGRFLKFLNPTYFQSITALIPLSSNMLLAQGNIQTNANVFGSDTIARIFGSGDIDSTFAPELPQFPGVGMIHLQTTGRILAGLSFSSPSPSNAPIVRLFPSGQRDTSFAVAPLSSGAVNTFAVDADDRIVIGGTFTNIDGRERSCVARLLPDGALDPSFHPGLGCRNESAYFGPSVLLSVIQPDGKILITGEFTEVDGTPRRGIARLLGDQLPNGPPTVFSQPVDQTVAEGQKVQLTARVVSPEAPALQWRLNGMDVPSARNETLTISRAKITDSGSYALAASNAFGVAISAPATLTVSPATVRPGSVDISFRYDGPPRAISYVTELEDGKLLVAGDGMIVRLNTDGSRDASFPTILIGGYVRDIHIQRDQRLLIVRDRNYYVSQNRSELIRLNPDGSTDLSFQPSANSLALSVEGFGALAEQPDGNILLAGDGIAFGGWAFIGGPLGGVTRVLQDGKIDSGFQRGSATATRYSYYTYSASNPMAQALAVDAEGGILLGGWFDRFFSYSLLDRRESSGPVVRLDPDGALDPSFRPDVKGDVTEIWPLADRKLLLAGKFPSLSVPGGSDLLIRLLPDGSEDSSFRRIPIPPGIPLQIVAVQEDGKVVAGTDHNRLYGPHVLDADYLIRFNADSSLDTGFFANVFDIGLAKLLRNQNLLVAGAFDSFDGYPAPGLVRLLGSDLPEGKPRIIVPPASQTAWAGTNLTLFVGAAVNPSPSYLWFHNGQPVAGQTNSTFNIPNVLPSAAGRYQVIVSNRFGAVSSTEAVLSVPPIENILGAVDPEFFPGEGPDGPISAMVIQSDGKIVIGGNFTKYNGVPRLQLARIHSDGSLDSTFVPRRGLAGPVTFLGLESDGALLVGGTLWDIGGQTRVEFRWLQSDGSENASRPAREIDGMMLALQPDGKWIVRASREGIIRLNADSSRDEAFAVPAIPWPPTLSTAGVQADGKIVFPGDPTTVGGASLVRVNADGSVDAAFQAESSQTGWDSIVPQPDGSILAVTAGRVFRFNCDGSSDPAYDIPLFVSPSAVHVALDQQERIFVSGGFEQINGIPRHKVARLFPGEPLPLPPLITAAPRAQKLKSGQTLTLSVAAEGVSCGRYQWYFNGQPLTTMTNRVLLLPNLFPPSAGNYSVSVGNNWGTVTSRVARIEVEPPPSTPGSLDLTFAPTIDFKGLIRSLSADRDGNLVVVGDWYAPTGIVPLWRRFHQGGQVDSSFHADSSLAAVWGSAFIETIAVQSDGKLLFGGIFTKVNDHDQGGILRLNTDGTFDDSFQPGSGPSVHDQFNQFNCCPFVDTILPLPDGKILVGGLFDTFAGEPRKGLARLNNDGSLDPTFTIGADVTETLETQQARVRALVPDESGAVFVGGYFHFFGGVARNHLARLLPDGSVDPNFAPKTDFAGWVQKLFVEADGRLLIGGNLQFAPDGSVRSVARLGADGRLDSGISTPPFFDFRLLALDSAGRMIGAATSYESSTGTYVASIVRLLRDGQVDATLKTRLSHNGVNAALALPNGDIVIAGDFTTVNDVPRAMLARLHGGSAELLRFVITSVAFEQAMPSFEAQIPSGTRYVLEIADSLPAADWQPLTNGLGDGTLKGFRDPAPSSAQRFYRLRSE
ncbi:MAG: immunoglobulin domain-containing protein [Verrucomicrobiales bacterium]|nr:immunoglobulin domain-containing protein [Verrucomicrobiales bacterium]